ncbi:maker619 [Drosophila busckii]|uniref:Maker619 n=1 Tax=Drosophila busckii TaxID=30019 RepID=A0A0M5IYX6_DROBS|nr:maker619 [Drosophila busckii]
MTRRNEYKNDCKLSGKFSLRRSQKYYEVPAGELILRVQCYNEKHQSIYHDVHFFLPAPKPAQEQQQQADRLSVMILGIDSLAHMNFLRMMPQTAAYIKQLPHVEFWGYNRVGLNSFPNLTPLLLGQSDEEVERGCYANKTSFDHCPLLWQQFKAAGYNTSFAEDSYYIGTFNYLKSGFRQQPTDFYLRPVLHEMHYESGQSMGKFRCTGNRKFAQVLHEFAYKLTPHLLAAPHFSFFWETEGVHDYFNYPKLRDADYRRLLQHLNGTQVLQRTLLLLMADHGLRFGRYRNTYQGMQEENQPLLIALYPSWLDAAFPLAMSHLRSNAHSLVTTFDLHVTLKDILLLPLLGDRHVAARADALSKLDSQLPRGISLFLPIPQQRDCQTAGILSEYCSCHKLSSMASADPRAQRAAQYMVKSINKLISNEPLCQRLRLQRLEVAYLYDSANNQREFEVKVRLFTRPGGGQFEGTTRFLDNTLALNGDIQRTNKYGNQSYCIQNYHIEMYCYC